MAIQMRRGLRKDFNPAKMLAGEWAVSIDSSTENQIVWMCFGAGIVKRMGTYEDFVENINEIAESIKEEYKTLFDEVADNAKASEDNAKESENNAKKSEDNAKASEDNAEIYSTEAKSYTVGGTNSRLGEDTDNAKYYSQKAKEYANEAKTGVAVSETAGNMVVTKDDGLYVPRERIITTEEEYNALPEDETGKLNPNVSYLIVDAD